MQLTMPDRKTMQLNAPLNSRMGQIVFNLANGVATTKLAKTCTSAPLVAEVAQPGHAAAKRAAHHKAGCAGRSCAASMKSRCASSSSGVTGERRAGWRWGRDPAPRQPRARRHNLPLQSWVIIPIKIPSSPKVLGVRGFAARLSALLRRPSWLASRSRSLTPKAACSLASGLVRRARPRLQFRKAVVVAADAD